MKYRKRPVVIDAWELTDEVHKALLDTEKPNDWMKEDGGMIYKWSKNGIYIQTLEGKMFANIGDYIIKGVNGEFYPCKPDIFEKTYEKC